MYEFRKIAVLKAGGLGDFIFTLPALEALKETYPDSEITYLGKAWHKWFLQERESPVDEVVVIPPVAGVGRREGFINDQKQLESFFKKMRRKGFDLAIALHGGGRYSNPLLLNLGAKMTIGTRTKEAASLSKSVPYHYYQNEYLRWLEVVSLIGAKTSNIMPVIKATKKDLQETKKVLGNKGKFIVIHPGASDPRRRWPPERFAKVGGYFAKLGFRIIVTGSGREKNLVEEVIKRMDGFGDNFYQKLTLNGLTGLLSIADLLISNDTGPHCLANALGCKTVGIYWCGNLINATLPFRKNTVALGSWIVDCPKCHKPMLDNCGHRVSFVGGVSTEEVIGAGESLLHMIF